jgi:ABC-type dipeptide/oligopeptide/nickel transport system permease subunit
LISRINSSPSLRKLFRNRLALCAMGIVGVYLLVFFWILAMEGVAGVGRLTGAYDLTERPVLGALLPERTLERVGAANLPGFGLDAAPAERTEQTYFYLELVGNVLSAIERQSVSDESAALMFEEIALAERRVADVRLAELGAMHRRAMEQFDSQASLRVLRARLFATRLAARQADEFSAMYRERGPDDDAALMVEEVMLSLEEVAFQLEELLPGVPEGSPLAGIDPAEFFAAAEALTEEPFPEPLYDPALTERLREAIAERLEGIDDEIDSKLDELEPLIGELMPVPQGVEGFLYRLRLLLGTDRQGRSIFIRAVYSAKVAIQVGVIVSVFAVGFGSLLGAAAGYFGGVVDHAVIWLYSTFSSIPDLVLLIVLAFLFRGSEIERTLIPLYVAFAMTYWIGPCRVTRGEALKLKQLDFVQAANALGAGNGRILVRHILPNTAHLVFINLSLLFIAAIKGEVVLTYLGLGLKEGASWGIMVDQSQPEVVSGFFWQIGAATFFMFVLVLAFNVLTDALQDAFDPKHVG